MLLVYISVLLVDRLSRRKKETYCQSQMRFMAAFSSH
jgi:hypothetical protein